LLTKVEKQIEITGDDADLLFHITQIEKPTQWAGFAIGSSVI